MKTGAWTLTLLVALGFLVSAAPAQSQCVYACDLRDGCFFCVSGASQEECHVACRVCWGFQCGPQPKVAIRTELEPIVHLNTIPATVLEEKFETPVRDILSNVWSGFNGTPGREADRTLDIRGKVLIDDEPYDFTLRIAQASKNQIYLLDILGYGKLDLTLTEIGVDRVRSELSWIREDGPSSWDRFSFMRPEPEARIVVRHSTH